MFDVRVDSDEIDSDFDTRSLGTRNDAERLVHRDFSPGPDGLSRARRH